MESKTLKTTVEALKHLDLFSNLNLLCKARNNLDHSDYIKIWGKQLGNHIWRQENNDLLRTWQSGLTLEQKKSFIEYIIKKFRK